MGVNCFSLTAGFKFADDFAVVPFANEKEYIPAMLELCDKKRIQILIPTVDEELTILSQNRTQFEKLGVKLAVSDVQVLQNCLDKWLCYKEFEKNDLPIASTWLVDENITQEKLDYPAIAKPRVGRGGRGIEIISCEDDLKLFKHKSNYIIQEYVDGEEFTVDTISDFNGKAITAVPRKRIEIKGGVCWKGKTEHNDLIINTCIKIVEKIGIKGAACVQLKLNKKGEIKVFEINPRIGGTTSLSVASGVDIPYLNIKLLNNERILPDELIFRDLYVSRYFEDVFFEESELNGRL